MAEENRTSKPHILTLPYPSQGHINPLLHLSKRLASKGAKTTLATTVFIAKSFTVCPPPLAKSSLTQFLTVSTMVALATLKVSSHIYLIFKLQVQVLS
ncbi:unnamed protein product [Rhodiola kirilowii]